MSDKPGLIAKACPNCGGAHSYEESRIAFEAGVSVSTVQRYFETPDHSKVGPIKRRRIRAAIERLAFSPDSKDAKDFEHLVDTQDSMRP